MYKRSHPQLQELQAIHKARVGEDDKWRVFSYTKSNEALFVLESLI